MSEESDAGRASVQAQLNLLRLAYPCHPLHLQFVLARMGWYREANVKSTESRYTHSLLAARAKLVDLRRDVENQMRGLLKGLGLPPGKGGIKALLEKIVVIMREAPHLRMLFNPMMLAHLALVTQVRFYDVQILKLAGGDEKSENLQPFPNGDDSNLTASIKRRTFSVMELERARGLHDDIVAGAVGRAITSEVLWEVSTADCRRTSTGCGSKPSGCACDGGS